MNEAYMDNIGAKNFDYICLLLHVENDITWPYVITFQYIFQCRFEFTLLGAVAAKSRPLYPRTKIFLDRSDTEPEKLFHNFMHSFPSVWPAPDKQKSLDHSKTFFHVITCTYKISSRIFYPVVGILIHSRSTFLSTAPKGKFNAASKNILAMLQHIQNAITYCVCFWP